MLKRYAFGPIQKLIDDRRERIRQSVEEADHAREEARSLLEEHRALIGQARRRGRVDPEPRRARSPTPSASGCARRPRRTASVASRRPSARSSRRPSRRSAEIRREVASLSLLAAEKITRKTLTSADQRRLIDEALAEIDFSELEASRS